MDRHPANPILTREDIPDLGGRIRDVSSVFNPGAIRLDDTIYLLLRVQTRGRETVWMLAESADGARFTVRPKELEIQGLDELSVTVHHAYDARLTRIDDAIYAVFAVDTDAGCHLAVARTEDLEHYELLGLDTSDEKRNGVLFPARWDDAFWRLERPNRAAADGTTFSGDTMQMARSTDLQTWTVTAPLAHGRWHYWDERIGSGPPPFRVAEGWLHIYHGIATHGAGADIYQAGVMLLDAQDPTVVLGRSRQNVLEPRELYEQVGQVPNVVFPSGLVIEGHEPHEVADPDARVLVYYGAADTCIGLATTTPAALLAALKD
ncbi:MAG: glycoside hydrolase family 130 protein [Planctomycetota bacterium]|nr:glycoside hydrolase family 130 protein [Planctomycetota bacterium]